MLQTNSLNCAWELSATPAPSTVALDTAIEVDVIVIGAGITGLSAAINLRASGYSSAVIEARSIGWGASGRNGGHVVPLLRIDPDNIIRKLGREQGERLIRVVRDSAGQVFSLIKKYGMQCDAEQVGWVQPGHNSRQVEAGKKRCQQWQQYSGKADYLDRQQVSTLLGTDAYQGGLLMHAGGHINPLSYVRELARVAIEKGARIFTGTPALNIKQAGDTWRVETPKGTVKGDKVILATASYSESIWPGLKQSIFPVNLYSVATKPLDNAIRQSVLPGRQPMTDSRRDARVFHYDGDGRLMGGGTFIFSAGWKKRLPKIMAKNLSETFPQIQNPEFETAHMWSGTVAMTRDFLPHLHILAPGVFSWIGCNARGIAFSTAMGKVFADLVRGTSHETLPLRPVTLQPVKFHRLVSGLVTFSHAYYRGLDKLGL